MIPERKPEDISVGIVGLGLMGCSIVVALLAAGHPVVAIAPLPEDEAIAPGRIQQQLLLCEQMGLLKHPINYYLPRLRITADYEALKGCDLVQECVIEKIEIKRLVYQKIAAVVNEESVISSNTSAIPISTLQQYVPNPERFIGIHWAEPAFATRFLEITCGDQTDAAKAGLVYRLAHYWGKEPTLLKKDIRGFITNRLMYAVYREALSLIEQGDASIEDADKAFRYDAGSWITMMGIFRRMDFEGLGDHYERLKNLLPQLSNKTTVPGIMQQMVDEAARGIDNRNGLYTYSNTEAQSWEKSFAAFNEDIFKLAGNYPEIK